VNLYERTVAMVDVDPERFYLVDLFAVSGGEQHDQSWHGPLRPVQAPPLTWKAQSGTLAGPDVAQFAGYTDRWGRKGLNFPCFLTNIRKTQLEQPAVWSWDYGLPEGDRLNLHVIPVGGPAEVLLGTGRSPARPADWGLDYLILRRKSRDGKPSLFLTVIDVYQKTPVVLGARLLSETPLVLEVTRSDGIDEIHLATPGGSSRGTAHRASGIRVRSRSGSRWTQDVQVGEYAPGKGPGYAFASIRAVDYENNRIALPYSAARQTDFVPGRTLRIFNWGRTGMFKIMAARRERSLLWLTLDKTALLAQGPVAKVEEGAVWLSATLYFANGHVDEKGRLKPGNDYFAGSWIGEGKAARMVQGAIRDATSKVFLKEPAPTKHLEKDYTGRVVCLWQYGIGDRMEIARIKDTGGSQVKNMRLSSNNKE